MMIPKNKEKLLLSKLRQPVHISYIAQYILKCKEFEAKEILSPYIEDGVIEESPLDKNYFGLKKQN
jgi:hypothetical protein